MKQFPRLLGSKFLAETYADGSYAAKNGQFGDDTASWKAANILAMMQARQHHPQTIGELGCGGGKILVELAKHLSNTREFHGYEPMPEAFAVCQSRATDKIQFFPQSLDATSASKHYDTLLMIDVFEHVEDYLGFLRGVRELADTFYFHIPLDMSVQMVARMKPFQVLREEVGHLHYFSKDTALATLNQAGYQILDHTYTDGSSSGYGSLKYRIMKWPRKVSYALSPDLAVRFLGGYSLLVAAKKK